MKSRPAMGMQWLLAVLAVAIVFGASTGRAEDASLAKVRKAGTLLVAIDPTYPPMESDGPDGKPSGFDIDFTNELARRIGVKAQYVAMNWDGILAGLASRRFDVIISTMNVTPERQKQVDFIEYLKISQLYVTRPGLTIKDKAELAGRSVAVQADTTSADYLEKVRKGGVAIKDVKAFKLAPDAFAALRAKQAEVIVIDEPVGRYFVKQAPKDFTITGRAMEPEPVGIAVRKSDLALRQELSHQLDAMRSDGTMVKLQQQWFGGELGK